MRTDAKTELEKSLLDSLADLADAVEEEMDPELRSEHLDTAFEDAMCLLFPEEEEEATPRYVVFTRTWWRENPDWPNGLEPQAGERKTIATVRSEEEAIAMCKDYNSTHEPGRLSLKAEFDLMEDKR